MRQCLNHAEEMGMAKQLTAITTLVLKKADMICCTTTQMASLLLVGITFNTVR